MDLWVSILSPLITSLSKNRCWAIFVDASARIFISYSVRSRSRVYTSLASAPKRPKLTWMFRTLDSHFW
jgi:hypothetical protein